MFFKKKETEETEETKTDSQPKQIPSEIILNQDDDCFQRARKLWRLAGFVNDRHGACAFMAEGIAAYMKLDASVKKPLDSLPPIN